jgi:hypothetical protein
MVKLTKNRAKALGIGLIVLGVSVALSILWLIFWGLSFLITGYVSAVLFVAMIYFTLRKLCQIIVFPGSFWIWKRSMESHFCKEMSMQLLNKISDLKVALDIVLELCAERDKQDFLP